MLLAFRKSAFFNQNLRFCMRSNRIHTTAAAVFGDSQRQFVLKPEEKSAHKDVCIGSAFINFNTGMSAAQMRDCQGKPAAFFLFPQNREIAHNFLPLALSLIILFS